MSPWCQDEVCPRHLDWYVLAPATALREAGAAYLHHVLSPDQLALYRVVIADAWRIPDLGTRYAEVSLGVAETLFVGYVDIWVEKAGWKIADKRHAARLFLRAPTDPDFSKGHSSEWRRPPRAKSRAVRTAHARRMLTLLEQGDC